MSLYDGIFYAFAIITVVSAFIVVLSKNIIYSAVSLFITLFGVAGFFVLLHADFIAVTQIMIYIGGILVLLIFGVMLTTKITDVKLKTKNINALTSAIFVIGITAVLIFIMLTTNWKVAEVVKYDETIDKIGVLLLTDYLLPFEIASIILLIALIGAAMYARKSK
ncbi:MAG: NADH-quinone oxidoreductase subunit J [Ignavibacteria bacterium]|nr:NADH-quinone oxidoreductase subunit J [Bacteroidota bacterium]MBL7127611.1 NADH-quinone oxidoreductase subunit J [Ignavibacteria bacterium]